MSHETAALNDDGDWFPGLYSPGRRRSRCEEALQWRATRTIYQLTLPRPFFRSECERQRLDTRTVYCSLYGHCKTNVALSSLISQSSSSSSPSSPFLLFLLLRLLRDHDDHDLLLLFLLLLLLLLLFLLLLLLIIITIIIIIIIFIF